VGYTPQLSTAVMISDPDLPRRPLEDVTIGGEHYDKMYGGSLAAPMWHDVMTQMDTELKLPAKGFNRQSADFDDGRDVQVPDVASMSYLEAIDRLEAAGFAAKLSDQVARSSQPIGNVAGSVPGAGTRAPYGQSVAIVLSGGPNGADLADIGRPAKPTPTPGAPSPGTVSPGTPSTAPPGPGAGKP
jgi:membrane peptidoglycan carboxypeptidase